MPDIIFCLEPFSNNQPDVAYEAEAEAAEACGFTTGLIDFEALTRNGGNAAEAARRIKAADAMRTALYRGWMLKPTQYEMLYAVLLEKNIQLVNSPFEYAQGHYFPGTYYAIQPATARSVYFPISYPVDFLTIHDKLSVFGGGSVIVKDYVKSRKYEWNDACFIFAADNRPEVERVVGNFIERQGDDLNGGLVFREFLHLRGSGERHPNSTYPVTSEQRFFVFRGEPVFASNYWNGVDTRELEFPSAAVAQAARSVGSNFFTVDVAQTVDDRFVIIEVGDGQVSGLPDGTDERDFYARLRRLNILLNRQP